MYQKINYFMIAGLASAIAGSLFRLLHWPGANSLLIVGMGTLALGSLIQSLIINRLDAYLEGATKAFALMAVLFKLMHWPNLNVLIALAVISGILWAAKTFIFTAKE
jgi:hypothetical protein